VIDSAHLATWEVEGGDSMALAAELRALEGVEMVARSATPFT
jgi:hypothetical protein